MKPNTTKLNFMMIGLCFLWATACSNEPSNNNTTTNRNVPASTMTPITNTDMGAGTGMGTGSDRAVAGSDLQFMHEAAMGSMTEVELGRIAVQKAANAEVKRFGQRMIDDHSRASQELTQLAGRKNVMLPQEKSADHQAMISRLSQMSGTAFDRAYISAMVEDHEKDVNEFETTMRNATDNDVKDFASRTLPTLREHLQMVRDIASKMKIQPKS